MTPDTLDPIEPDIPLTPALSAKAEAEADAFHRQVADGMARARILRGKAARQALAAVFLLPLRIASLSAARHDAKEGTPAAASH